MFGYKIVKQKTQNAIKAVITSFDGFFDVFSTAKNPLSLAPVYASIKIISQTVGISPLKLYKKTKNGREVITNDLSKIMREPYGLMTSMNWLQMLVASLAGRGNAYALIVRDANYNIRELIPLEWDMVYIYEDISSNNFYYQVNFKNKNFVVWAEDILHFKIFSEDGKRGLNPIELHRQTIDQMTGENDYNEAFYKQAVNISGVIEAPGRVDQKAIDSIKEGFASKYSGVANSGKTAILPDGMTYTQLNMLSPRDAAFIESAKLTRSDIAVIFGLPLALLGDLSQATFSNLSELNRSFYKMTIAPYMVAIAQELSMKLLDEKDKDDFYFEFDPDIILSADKKTRYETYAIGIDNGIITRNEVRELENLEKLDGLDEVLQKSGVMTMSQADENFKKEENDLTKDMNSLEATIKKSGLKNQSDVLSHLGRMQGLVKTSSKTSNKTTKV